MKTLLCLILLLPILPMLADDTIPAPLKASRYEDLWLNSPFLRSLNAAESYVITSVASIDGKPFVTLCNTTTGERFTLSNVKNSQGWRLIDLRTDSDPRNVIARVSIADEEMTVRFGDDQISAKALLTAAQGTTANPPSSAAFKQNETLRLQTALRERLLQGGRPGKGPNNANTPGDINSNKSGNRRTQQGK